MSKAKKLLEETQVCEKEVKRVDSIASAKKGLTAAYSALYGLTTTFFKGDDKLKAKADVWLDKIEKLRHEVSKFG